MTWFGLFAPAGTPREIVMKLHVEVQRVFADENFQEKFIAPQMFQPMTASPEEFAAFIYQQERRTDDRVIRDATRKHRMCLLPEQGWEPVFGSDHAQIKN